MLCIRFCFDHCCSSSASRFVLFAFKKKKHKKSCGSDRAHCLTLLRPAAMKFRSSLLDQVNEWVLDELSRMYDHGADRQQQQLSDAPRRAAQRIAATLPLSISGLSAFFCRRRAVLPRAMLCCASPNTDAPGLCSYLVALLERESSDEGAPLSLCGPDRAEYLRAQLHEFLDDGQWSGGMGNK